MRAREMTLSVLGGQLSPGPGFSVPGRRIGPLCRLRVIADMGPLVLVGILAYNGFLGVAAELRAKLGGRGDNVLLTRHRPVGAVVLQC